MSTPSADSVPTARPEGDGIHWTDTVHCGRIFCVRCGPPPRRTELHPAPIDGSGVER